MPLFYKIDKPHKLVMTTASGVFDLAAAYAHQDQLLKDPDFDPVYSQLLDFTQVTKVEFSADDVRQIARRSVFWPCSSRAILVNDDLLFGLATLFEMLRANAGEKGVRVFRSLNDALDWIIEGNACD
jgi:hypothetical protein